MDIIKKILITREGKKFYVRNNEEDFHTQYGFIKKGDLKKAKNGSVLFTSTNKELSAFEPFFADLYRKIKRDAQIIPLKDIGFIIAETGINKKSRILDAGSGSGALACFLAGISKEVITYEIREDFIEIVRKNIDFLSIKNITIKKINIFQNVEEKNVDVVTLDVPEPWNALENCAKALKHGGFLVSYSPSIPQVIDFVNAVRKNNKFIYLKTVEIIEREWEVEDRKVRPKSKGLGHSGFLSFARKVK